MAFMFHLFWTFTYFVFFFFCIRSCQKRWVHFVDEVRSESLIVIKCRCDRRWQSCFSTKLDPWCFLSAHFIEYLLYHRIRPFIDFSLSFLYHVSLFKFLFVNMFSCRHFVTDGYWLSLFSYTGFISPHALFHIPHLSHMFVSVHSSKIIHQCGL